MASYEEFFKKADKDGSGMLSVNELITALRNGGHSATDSEIKKLFGGADRSGDKRVSLEEFLAAMGVAPSLSQKEALMRQVFKKADKDGSGQIDKHELKQVLAEMGKSFSDEEMKRMKDLADKDKSGTMSYEEFIRNFFGAE